MFDKAIVIIDRMTKDDVIKKHTKEERIISQGFTSVVITKDYDAAMDEWVEVKTKELSTKIEIHKVLFVIALAIVMLGWYYTPTYKQEYINSVKENNDLKRELRKMNAERAKVREIIKGDSLGTLMYW